MKRLTLVISIALVAFARQPKSKAKPAPDPEARWMCRIGSYHNCHCPAMIAEEHEAGVQQCARTTQSEKEYIACLSRLPGNCEIIQKADSKHPEHTCKRSCSHAKCQCWDGPPCEGPSLTEGAGYSVSPEETQ